MIRAARLTDIPQSALIYRDSFPEALSALFGQARIDPAAIESVLRSVYDYEPEGFLVAEHEGRIAGFSAAVSDIRRFRRRPEWYGFLLKSVWRVCIAAFEGISCRALWNLGKMGWRYALSSPRETPLGRSGRILWVAVHPEYRDGVIGPRLIQAAEAYLKRRLVSTIRVEINVPKTSLVGFYKSLGYVPIGQAEFLWGPALVMEKSYSDTILRDGAQIFTRERHLCP